MARCPDCNKFVSNEETDPEVESVEIEDVSAPSELDDVPNDTDDADAEITASVRIVNACADCGTELAEAELEPTTTITIPGPHRLPGHEISVDETGSSRTSRSEGKGRGMRTFYGATIDVEVSCSCGKMLAADGKALTAELSDDVQASGMDSLT